MKGTFLLVTVSIAVGIAQSESAVINVPVDESTIQAGIDVAVSGDTILVDSGTYVENINYEGKSLRIMSIHGPTATSIIGDSPSRAVVEMIQSEASGTSLQGFTISGGNASGILCVQSSPLIANNIITENYSQLWNRGGGISLVSTDGAEIIHNVFHNNETERWGAGIHIGDDNENTLNTIVRRNIFYDNTGIHVIRILGVTSNTIIHNNTLDVTSYSGIFDQGTDSSDVRNNIIVNAPDRAAFGAHAEYNCFFNVGISLEGSTNFEADPLFLSINVRDYRLQYDSPCRDAGDPGPLYNDSDGSRNDIGAIACIPQDDTDGDGVDDCVDNCVETANPSQTDSDQDGLGDLCDICPLETENDADGDGLCASVDVCPLDRHNDADGDGFCADVDNCPDIANSDQADEDNDGIGDVCDLCTADGPMDDCCCDIPGNADAGGSVSIGDLMFLIAYIFSGGSEPPCRDEGDANGDNSINISDVTYLIARIFSGGPPPICGTTGS